ncbi:mitochondrial ribosomal protein, S26 [Culex quinquefasciatus]|uniref:Mitochondrial ribosomal protein, S26 n=1 Tax=Culex quinquefasciatus TaxID=7176 RepID=B0W630_CULQU|nr:mitochondrial ribosomal protein, S26 [Culex quinquefasciatus]|eukprot:XP_001844164.1 mitochondrial ribosomal protein, S26 [Culex quinquefasciatus]
MKHGHFDSGGQKLKWPVPSKQVPPGPGGPFTESYVFWQYGYHNSWFLILNMKTAISTVVTKNWSGRCPRSSLRAGKSPLGAIESGVFFYTAPKSGPLVVRFVCRWKESIEEDRVKLMQLFKNFYIQIKAVPRFLIDEVEAFTLAYRYGPPNYEWEEVAEVGKKRQAQESDRKKNVHSGTVIGEGASKGGSRVQQKLADRVIHNPDIGRFGGTSISCVIPQGFELLQSPVYEKRYGLLMRSWTAPTVRNTVRRIEGKFGN